MLSADAALASRVLSVLSLPPSAAADAACDASPLAFVPDALDAHLARVGAAAEAAAEGGSAPPAAPSPVALSRHGVSPAPHGGGAGALCGATNFGSARAERGVTRGRWQYEAALATDGVMQLGWATAGCVFTSREGVGDSPDSYAYDGRRQRRWAVSCHPYGQQWAAGDVIGVALDLEARTVSYSRNGVSMGAAFQDVRAGADAPEYFAAVSLSQGEGVELELGGLPLQYPLPGHSTLQAPPPPAERAAADYLCSCLCRLAAEVTSPCVGDGAEAEADEASQEGRLTGDDAVLIAFELCTRVAPLLTTTPHGAYHTTASLAPALLTLHAHCGADALAAAAALMSLVLDPADAAIIVPAVFWALARQARAGALMGCAEALLATPAVAAAAALVAAGGVWAEAWAESGEGPRGFHAALEALLTPRQHSDADLAAMLPGVTWHSGGVDAAARDGAALAAAAAAAAAARAELAGALAAARGAPLRRHVAWLLSRNRHATRALPPPGLSPPRALHATAAALLRLLRPHLDAAERAGAGNANADTSTATEAAHPVLATFPGELLCFGGAATLLELPRLGGVASHLAKTAPCEPADAAPLRVSGCGEDWGAAWTSPTGDAAAAAAVPLSADDAAAYVDAVLCLWHLGAGAYARAGGGAAQAAAAATAALETAEARLAAAGAAADGGAAAATRDALRADVAEAARRRAAAAAALAPCRCDLSALVAYAAALVLAASAASARLFAHVPEFFVEGLLEAFHSLRRADPPHPGAGPTTATSARVTALLARAAGDARIASPGVREALLQGIGLLLQQRPYVTAFERSPPARAALLPSLLASFADRRYWVPSAAVLLRLLHPAGAGLPRSSSDDDDDSAAEQLPTPPPAPASPLYAALLREHLAADTSACASFADAVLSQLAWAAAELAVALRELRDAAATAAAATSLGRRAGAGAAEAAQHAARRCAVMLELSINLARLAAVLATSAPAFFLAQGGAADAGALALQRLAESALFLLRLSDGGAEEAAEAAAAAAAASMRVTPALTRMGRAALRAAAAGAPLALFAAERDAAAGPSAALAAAPQRSMVTALAACRDAGAAAAALRALPIQVAPAAAALADALDAAAAQHAAADAAIDAAGAEAVPDEFLDPLLATLMTDPVVLPSSGMRCDRATIARHLAADATDPFSRAPLAAEQLVPDEALRQRIQAWLAGRGGRAV